MVCEWPSGYDQLSWNQRLLINGLLSGANSKAEGGDESKGGWAQSYDRGSLSTCQEDPKH
jgi:hypothetical protein